MRPVKVMNESLSHIEGSWAKEDYIVKVQGLGMLRFPYLTRPYGKRGGVFQAASVRPCSFLDIGKKKHFSADTFFYGVCNVQQRRTAGAEITLENSYKAGRWKSEPEIVISSTGTAKTQWSLR